MINKRYRYNPNSLSYDEVKMTWTSGIVKVLGFIVIVVLFSVTLLYVATDYINTPEEIALRNKLDEVNYKLESISGDLSSLTKEIETVHKRDVNVHRVILGMEPSDESLWNSGIGGHKKYKGMVNYSSTTRLAKETIEKAKELRRKVDLQNASLDTLEKLAIRRADRLASLPSIKPVREDKLKRKISYMSGFGYRDHPIYHINKFHKGIDLTCPAGTHIQATGNGVVEMVKRSKRGYGKHIVINHGYGYKTIYAHMSKIDVEQGDKVLRGQKIGLVGSTGASTAPHLHYEVRINGEPVDPINFIYDGMTTEEYAEFINKAKEQNQSLD